MGSFNGQEGGNDNNNNNDEFDLLKMDPNMLTFEQQIRRAELESLKDLRQQQMNQEGINQNNQQPTNTQNEDVNQVEVEIEGVSNERLQQIINKDVNDMEEDEILI